MLRDLKRLDQGHSLDIPDLQPEWERVVTDGKHLKEPYYRYRDWESAMIIEAKQNRIRLARERLRRADARFRTMRSQ
jgi:hypothetical protein